LNDLIVEGNIDIHSGLGVLRERIAESIALITIMKEKTTSIDGGLYRDWIVNQVDKHDIADFYRKYNVFRVWEKKQLNNKRIHNMRILYDMILKPKA